MEPNRGRAGSGGQQIPTTLNDSMQYTPLTSIAPSSFRNIACLSTFKHSNMPVPSLTNAPQITQQTSIFQLPEQQNAQSRETYDLLNAPPQTQEHADYVEGHIQSLKDYLTTPDLQILNFEVPPAFASLPSSETPMNRSIHSFELGRFSERLLLNSDVPFHYSLPQHGRSAASAGTSQSRAPLGYLLKTLQDAPSFPPPRMEPAQQTTVIDDSNQFAARNGDHPSSLDEGGVQAESSTVVEARRQLNSAQLAQKTSPRIENEQFVQHTQHAQISADSDRDSQVGMRPPQTPSLAISDTSATEAFPSSVTSVLVSPEKVANGSPKKRKSPEAAGRSDKTKIKRENDESSLKAQLALNDLQNLIDNIFEADDDVEKDTSGIQRAMSSLWIAGSLDTEPLLANDSQIRLEGAIRRVITSRTYSQVSIDDVLRLQRICVRSVKHASAIGWKGYDSLASGEELTIFSDISATDNALKSCKTIIRTMLGSRKENQICSEGVMRDITDFIGNTLETLLLPLIPPIINPEPIYIYKKQVVGLLQELTRTVNLIYQLLLTQDLSEAVITRLEFISIGIIFVEHAAKERESFMGTSFIENLRVAAMDVLAHIFSSYRDQRIFILGEILSSLEKLPIQRLSARHYKLVGGGNIQLVSALILRLIQTAGSLDSKTVQESAASRALTKTADTGDQDSDLKAREQFIQMCQSCNTEAVKSATDVVNFLVERAMKSTKSGDAPYRVLLDLFIEDFITVLEFPEWPGAELLLRCLAMQMIGFVGDSYSAQVNSMALDILGTIGSTLQNLRSHPAAASQLTATSSKQAVEEVNSLAMAVLLYLHKSRVIDTTSKSSYEYLLALWPVTLCSFLDSDSAGEAVASALRKLTMSANDDSWASKEEYTDDTPANARANYVRILVQMPLYKLYDRIRTEVLHSLDSPRIVSRTKGIRVLGILIARDPTILSNSNVMSTLSSRLRDQSAQVRDAAVEVVGKYVLINPEVTKSFYMLICERSGDTGTGVRRRVLKLLKDVYLATTDMDIKLEIADRLLRRLEDVDPGVKAVAKKNLEDMWFGPVAKRETSDDLEFKAEIESRLYVLLQVRERSDKAARLIQSLAQDVFEPGDKSSSALQQAQTLSKAMVDSLFEIVVDWTDSDKMRLQSYFSLLSTFAVANRSIFEAEQLVTLQSYLQDTKDDASTYYVLIIFRQILPSVGTLRTKLITDIQQTLLTRLSRFNLRELSEAVPCLWTTSVMLKDTRRLATTAVSCLKVIAQFKSQALQGKLLSADTKLMRLLHLLGHIGRYCNLEEHVEMFKAVPGIKGRNVTEMLVLTMQIFSQPKVVPTIGRIAVRNLGMICIAHPQIFMASSVMDVFDDALTKGDKDKRETVVQLFSEFLTYEQDRADIAVKQRGGSDKEVDVRVLKGESANYANDSVCASLVQRHLDSILEITLASEDSYALSAVLLLEKIVRQGYPNPRSCVPTLIALETSTHPGIKALALDLHQKLHEKHESLIESCYIEGVKKSVAFERSMTALSVDRPVSYECMVPLYSVIKSSRATRKKFLAGLTKAMDFDSSKFATGPISLTTEHLAFVSFVARNLPCVEMTTSEEPHVIIHGLDQVIASTGMSLLYLITEHSGQASQVVTQQSDSTTTRADLSNLAACSAILFAIWRLRQHVQRLFNLSEQSCRTFQPSKSVKDIKAVSKSSGCDERLELESFCLQDSFDDEEQSLRILESTKSILAAAEPGL